MPRESGASSNHRPWFYLKGLWLLDRPLSRAMTRNCGTSRGDELVPLLDEVVVLVHHRVPAYDRAHARLVGAAVAHRAGLLEQRAVGGVDVLFGRLAFHPISPLVALHLALPLPQHAPA